MHGSASSLSSAMDTCLVVERERERGDVCTREEGFLGIRKWSCVGTTNEINVGCFEVRM